MSVLLENGSDSEIGDKYGCEKGTIRHLIHIESAEMECSYSIPVTELKGEDRSCKHFHLVMQKI